MERLQEGKYFWTLHTDSLSAATRSGFVNRLIMEDRLPVKDTTMGQRKGDWKLRIVDVLKEI